MDAPTKNAKRVVERSPKKKPAIRIAGFLVSGARSWTRTNDPLINSQVL